MGRPREHDERTRAELLAAAERLVANGGPDALSVRAVADEIGATTRAVYSVFGSKDGLVSALAQRAFEILETGLKKARQTDDPAEDLIYVGVGVFRRFVREHPSLFRIAFQRVVPGLQPARGLVSARERVFPLLMEKVQRVADAGLLDGKPVRDATVEFNAMCEGLANAELRGGVLPILVAGEEEHAWREALATVIRGFGGNARHAVPRRRRR